MRNKYITYQFSYSIICFTLLFRDWWILPHTQRIHQSRNCKAEQSVQSENCTQLFLTIIDT